MSTSVLFSASHYSQCPFVSDIPTHIKPVKPLINTKDYIGQRNRYKIYEELGCLSALYPSTLGFILIYAIPICLPFISLIFYSRKPSCQSAVYHNLIFGYSVVAWIVWAFYKHRREMEEHLATDSLINRSNYIRFLILGCVDILFTLPVTIINFLQEVLSEKTTFWPGFAVVHAQFSTIPTTTTEQWKSLGIWVNFIVRFNQWINPVWAVIFFGIFGFSKEARARYSWAFWKVVRPFGFKPRPQPEVSEVMFGTLSAVQQDMTESKYVLSSSLYVAWSVISHRPFKD